ncbi:MAG: hypothetical protein J6C98_09180 [Oscillospiraceae bacterium]|nr:hypothetical protein [Oscillospiraceae bacterium]
MPSKVTNYQCPSCTGPLHFEEHSGRLECEYCESTYSLEEIEALFAQKNQKAETAAEQVTESSDAEWGEDASHMRSYNCPSCGAELICEETTAATACPYCGNPTVIPGQFGGTKRPDCIIPFKVGKEQAVEALKQHYQGKLLLPKAFASENHLQEIKGVYVPFWLFDATADVQATFSMTRSHTQHTRDERIVTTEHYEAHRSGRVEFSQVPVDGSSKMPDGHMDAVEPYDYGELKPFSLSYLPGFLADKYDVDQETSAARAEERCRNSAISTMADTVRGYDTCSVRQADVKLSDRKASYALMPVWLLSTRWKEKEYLFAMNGQTGRFVGDLPVSWGKFWLWFAGLFLVISLIGSMFLDTEAALIAGAVLAGIICGAMVSVMKSARQQSHANAYIPAEGVELLAKNDRFLHRTVTRHRNQQPQGGPHHGPR